MDTLQFSNPFPREWFHLYIISTASLRECSWLCHWWVGASTQPPPTQSWYGTHPSCAAFFLTLKYQEWSWKNEKNQVVSLSDEQHYEFNPGTVSITHPICTCLTLITIPQPETGRINPNNQFVCVLHMWLNAFTHAAHDLMYRLGSYVRECPWRSRRDIWGKGWWPPPQCRRWASRWSCPMSHYNLKKGYNVNQKIWPCVICSSDKQQPD